MTMQAEYPKKINPTYWDRVHIQPRVRKFPNTGDSSETIGRKWRPPPEVVEELKPQVPELMCYDRDYTVTNQLTRSQTCEEFGYKAPETHRFNKHTTWTENEYIYPPSRMLSDQPPLPNAHGMTAMRHAYKIPTLPPTLVTDKNQHKHPACLPLNPPMIEPSWHQWHKDLEPLDTTYEGYEKYLDPYLTTSRLHHRPYTAEQLNRRSVTKDIVTYHTLSNEPWIMADSTTGQDVNEAPQEDLPREQQNEHRSLSPLFDWPINIVVSEPKILNPDADIAQQGKEVQKLGPEWKTVRYAETKRQFETKAPFCALQVNYELESLTPRCKSFDMLQRFDQTLAAITHGLLKQKKILQDTVDSLPAEMQETVRNTFLSADSQFKKISDDLLQYVCGRRSQVIQHRREMFLPRNLGVRNALHAIPPTDILLFEPNRLAQLIQALPDKIDHFVPNTDKCKCCQFHKQRRSRQSSDTQNDEDDAQSTTSNRRRKHRKRRDSADTQNSEFDSQPPKRKRCQKQHRRNDSSDVQDSEDDRQAPRRKRRHHR